MKPKPQYALVICFSALVGMLSISCGTANQARPGGEEAKITCEAYLFDTKIDRNGKQNSMRLEIYQTDSVLGLNGRAYLGKGALRGKVTSDTLAVYLPHTNEYVYQPISAVLKATECSLDSLRLDITKFFRTLPDSLPVDPRVKVLADWQDPKHPVYEIWVPTCTWQMELIYVHEDKGWRILKFAFTNGKELTLSAVRREYRSSTGVKAERLQFSYPAGAERISL